MSSRGRGRTRLPTANPAPPGPMPAPAPSSTDAPAPPGQRPAPVASTADAPAPPGQRPAPVASSADASAPTVQRAAPSAVSSDPRPPGQGKGGSDESATTSSGSGSSVVTQGSATSTTSSVVTVVDASSGPSSSTTDSSSATIETSLSDLSINSLPQRPGYCETGRVILLYANYFLIGSKNTVINVYHYRIDLAHVKREGMKREELRELFWELAIAELKWVTDLGKLVYDGGNNVYSTELLQLPNELNAFANEYKVKLSHDLRLCDYKLAIRLVGKCRFDIETNQAVFDSVESAIMTPVQFVDLLFHQYYALPRKFFALNPCADGGRSFYFIPPAEAPNGFPLSHGVEGWSGYFIGAKHCDRAVMVNIDTSNGVFYACKKSALQYLCDALNTATKSNMYNMRCLNSDTRLTEKDRRTVEKAFQGVEFKVTHLKSDRVYKIRAMTSQTCRELQFTKRDAGSAISVAEYFAETYPNNVLKYPSLPCFIVGPKKREMFFPIEVCELIAPQKYRKKLSEEQTSAMIKAVCLPAPNRRYQVSEVLEKANLQHDPFLNHFDITVGKDMARFEARRLETPKIVCADSRSLDPRDGVWSLDRYRFYNGVTLQSEYALISFVNKRQELVNFCQMLAGVSNSLGMKNIEEPGVVEYVRDCNEFHTAVHRVFGRGISFVLVVMEKKDTFVYGKVKFVCDVTLGLVSQCVIMKNVLQCKPTTVSNILLKLNTKLDGVNWTLKPARALESLADEMESMMFLGIDVSHPGPTDRKAPSVAAVVGNIDFDFMQYGASVLVQKYRKESVLNLSKAIHERIFAYYKRVQRAPKRIIVYRDGVAEGQFDQVIKEEVSSIRKACTDLAINYKPQITIIIVQKRHHTRLFCYDQREECGKSKNVPPGTLADKFIGHSTNFDFFLCSHFGIQGTSRPSHYHVILDENGYSAGQIHTMTYHLSHLYARCTRSVSIPAPVYYAHLACTRARIHLQKIVTDSDSLSASSGGTDITDDQYTEHTRVQENLRYKMYYV